MFDLGDWKDFVIQNIVNGMTKHGLKKKSMHVCVGGPEVTHPSPR